ncbi:hypothetical protein Emag_007692 [Eimeria magna]
MGNFLWTSFLSSFSRHFIARPSARVREAPGSKQIPEYEPEIQPDPDPVRFLFSALQALGGRIAPRSWHGDEESDEVVEARPGLPTPACSRVSAELEGSADFVASGYGPRIGSSGDEACPDFAGSAPAYGTQWTEAAAAPTPKHGLSRRRLG